MTGRPDECESLGGGDFDGDGAVTLDDLVGLAGVLGGPGQGVAPPIERCATAHLAGFDADDDGDLDLIDFAAFERAFTGE